MTTTVWTGCYADRWPATLLAESVVHPAKFARGLIRRIYRHCLDTELLRPGDTVLDPFGGVGLGALDALASGLNWVGVELEPLYAAMGRGCACTGISAEDWVRFFGRWKQAAYSDGRNWCPRCLAEAERVDRARQPTLFDLSPTAAYIRNSLRVPFTGPHQYEGNLHRFASFARSGAQARLIHGDSRRLVEVLAGSGDFGALFSSPPYVHSVHDGSGIDQSKLTPGTGKHSQAIVGGGYGREKGQLGVMPVGNFNLVMASPPYGVNDDHDYTQAGRDLRRGHTQGQGSFRGVYGDTPGQLARLPYGLVSSPPYEDSVNQHATANDADRRLERMRRAGIDVDIRSNPGGTNGVMRRAQVYGESTGQLGAEAGDTFWSAARQIVGQCHDLLAPGSPAVWVVKDYVRDWQRVEFARQWREMCQAAGFEHLYDIHASVIEERGRQFTIDGEVQVHRIERKSFFRRQVEKQGAPEINEEVVIFTRKRAI